MEFNISILCGNLSYSKRISNVLRKFNVNPYVFDNRHEFWRENLDKPSHLAFVFVDELVEQATFAENEFGWKPLHEHPSYQNLSMSFVFFSDRSNLPLMKTAFELFCFGSFVIEDEGLEKKVEGYLRKIELGQRLVKENRSLKVQLVEKERQINTLAQVGQQELREKDFNKELKRVTRIIQKETSNQEFFDGFAKVMDGWEEIESFAFVEPTLDGNKIVSPYFSGVKYKVLPSCFVGGKRCLGGIETLGTSLSYQMACDFFSKEFITLSLRLRPEDRAFAIVYIQAPKEFIEEFDWEQFSLNLSGFYSKSLVSKIAARISDDQYLSPWGFQSFLNSGEEALENFRFYLLDYSNLIEVAKRVSTSNFQWGTFEDHFKAALKARLNQVYKGVLFDDLGFVFVVNEEEAEEFEVVLSKLSKTFSYWRYFENPDLILAESLTPRLKVLRPHREFITSFIDNHSAEKIEKRKLRTSHFDKRILSNSGRPPALDV